jgi:hypothetical protein
MICRLELTNTFSFDIVVQGFLLKESIGRKSYVKGKKISSNVKCNDFAMDVLMEGLSSGLSLAGIRVSPCGILT